MRQGVSASRVWLPKNGDHKNSTEKYGEWNTVLEFLTERFPFIPEDILLERMSRGDIVSEDGTAFNALSPYQAEIFLFYYREIPDEPAIPFKEQILFKDDNIIVVDKPTLSCNGLLTLCTREFISSLKHQYQIEEISPVHRLDRETAGVMMFTCNKDVRGAYQNLFQKRLVKKTYEAIATISALDFPLTYKSRINPK